jgi:DHA1 family tetracycline resistance protein-like MFS transporter
MKTGVETATPTNAGRKADIGVVFVVVLLDILAFSTLLPVLSYYATTFGATPFQIGLLGGLYACCQLIGAPLMARLSDRFGRKPMFLVDVSGSIIGFLLLGFANALWMIVASRVIAGLVAANIPIAQAAISDLTDHNERSRGLGVLGAAFGIGFTIGPAIGGFLSRSGAREDYAVAAFVSLGFAALNWLVIAFLLKESRSADQNINAANAPSARRAATFVELLHIDALKAVLADKRMAAMLLYWLLFSLAFATFQQNIALFNQFHLHLTARQTSYVFVFVGVSVAVSQGLLLRPLTRRFSDVQLLLVSTPVMACALALWAWSPNLAVLLIALAPLCCAGSILIAVANSILTKSVNASNTGGITGLAGLIDNGTRVVGAASGGWLMQNVGTFAPGMLAALLVAALVVYTRSMQSFVAAK